MRPVSPDNNTINKKARFVAVLWTLSILLACLTPSGEIPKVDVPFVDKWTHLVMFGGFSFLWLLAGRVASFKRILVLIVISAAYGAVIEVLQGVLVALGRSMELMDFVADALGGILGAGLFAIIRWLSAR